MPGTGLENHLDKLIPTFKVDLPITIIRQLQELVTVKLGNECSLEPQAIIQNEHRLLTNKMLGRKQIN